MSGLNTIAKLYTVEEIAVVLGMSKITVYRLIETRKISFYKIKGCIRFAETDVLRFLDSNRVGPAG